MSNPSTRQEGAATPENPSAFPSVEQWNEWSELKAEYVPKTGPRGGMTLRDYFAGQALVGFSSACTRVIPAGTGVAVDTPSVESLGPLAVAAYMVADAMLAQREKQS